MNNANAQNPHVRRKFRRSWRQQILHIVGLALGMQVRAGGAVMGKIELWDCPTKLIDQ
jgi:hypothetical protein